ncbi:MAG: carboxymuconolactone decarboxylase family protein [Rhodoferax sp.]|nr:carboxymuconolactone decarboxylase family protein [Rhodoferax sp.]
MGDVDERRAAIKQAFIEKRGYWAPWHEDLLALNPDFLQAYLGMTSLAWTDGVLEPKVKEFIYIAIDAATTHLYERGLRLHIATALQYGATREEIMEVLQLTSQLGWHTCTVGVPILAEELRKTGQDTWSGQPLAATVAQLKTAFEKDLGFWDDCCELLARMHPSFLEAYYRFTVGAWTSGVLEPRVKEFVALAVSASTTHLHEVAIRMHIRRALALGASAQEIMEVLQLTSVLGIHTCSIGVPIFGDELRRAGKPLR